MVTEMLTGSGTPAGIAESGGEARDGSLSGCGEVAKGAHGDPVIAGRETDTHIAARLEDHPRQQVDLKRGGIGRRRGDAEGRRHKIR